jgi:hypothetical protein
MKSLFGNPSNSFSIEFCSPSKYLFLLFLLILFIGCEKDKQVVFRINSIDIETMAQKHLPDFELIYQRQNWIFYEYLFKRPNDNVEIILRINICNSKADADSIVNVYFSDISAYYSEGPFKGESVGEKFWWSTFTSTEYPSSIAFIRDNLVFVLNEYGYSELISLAKKIDYDILHRASYITYDDQ